MAKARFCRGALVIALVGLSAGCGPLLPDESWPAAGTEVNSQPGGAVPMQGPHGTPSMSEAKEALLAVLRSGGMRDLSSVTPDKLSRQAEEPVGDGTWQWGPFSIDLSTKTYSYRSLRPRPDTEVRIGICRKTRVTTRTLDRHSHGSIEDRPFSAALRLEQALPHRLSLAYPGERYAVTPISTTPASSATDSLSRSCEWNCSSGSRSERAMQRNVPAENASAPAVIDDAAPGAMPAEPSTKRTTPAGIISPKPRLTRCTTSGPIHL